MATDTIIIDPGGGGDYTSWASAQSSEITDLQVADKSMVFKCRGGSGSCGSLVLTGYSTWNTDATHTITIEAESGSEHDGTADTTTAAHFQENANPVVNLAVSFVTIKNLILENLSTSTSAATILAAPQNQGGAQSTFVNCIGKMPKAAATSVVWQIRGNILLVNCVGMGGTNCLQTSIIPAGLTIDIYHCTFAGGNRGILLNDSDGNPTISNCYCHGATQAYHLNQGSATVTKIATSDTSGTPAGLHNIPFATATFKAVTDVDDYDPHLSGITSALYDAGDDTSAATGYTEDYEGGDRNHADAGAGWDIGADEEGVARGAVAAAATIGRNIVPILRPGRRAVGGFV